MNIQDVQIKNHYPISKLSELFAKIDINDDELRKIYII